MYFVYLKSIKLETMEKELINTELGLRLNYWDGKLKSERVFLSSQIMKQLGYKGGNAALAKHDLDDNIDKITIKKKDHPQFIQELINLGLIGNKTATVIMLYESGVWKLIMGSKKQIGINTRNWLAREVLPSIHHKGYYDSQESANNPLSYLHTFTEEKTQKQESKDVNSRIAQTTGDFSAYHNRVHQLVNNMSAKEIKEMFKSKKSARALIREHLPENAATIALIDELYKAYNKNLDEIEKTGIHKSAKETFRALFELGVKPMM